MSVCSIALQNDIRNHSLITPEKKKASYERESHTNLKHVDDLQEKKSFVLVPSDWNLVFFVVVSKVGVRPDWCVSVLTEGITLVTSDRTLWIPLFNGEEFMCWFE